MEFCFVLGRERGGDSYKKGIRTACLDDNSHMDGGLGVYRILRLLCDVNLQLQEVDEIKTTVSDNDSEVISTICALRAHIHFYKHGVRRMVT